MKQILVINPNSSPQVTAQIDEAVQAALRFGPVAATTMGSDDGPAAIESDEDVARSVPVISQLVEAHSADAYVIACFADPGVDEVRSITDKPVFGIAESGVLTAMARGRRVAVVSGSEAAVRRHTRYWKAIGVADRIVADLPVGLGVLALASGEGYDRVREATVKAVELGADAVVLGCAGLVRMRSQLQRDVGVPVIEPCGAAVAMAAAALLDV